MLVNTFSHIQGIGLKTEQRFWQAGITEWQDFFAPLPLKFSAAKLDFIQTQLHLSQQNLPCNPSYFTRLLAAHQHWRLFPHFRHRTLYLDIESTGIGGYNDHITTIATYDGRSIACYVHGDNLHDFITDVAQYDVLITYNGTCFDIPFIEQHFGIQLHQAHIDLRYVLHKLGYKGGLKGCEKQLGLDRGELDGVDGSFAVLLWHEYLQSADPRLLQTLLAYNIEDAVNLEVLMVAAYNLNVQETPFLSSHQLSYPSRPSLPFQPDSKIVERLKRQVAGRDGAHSH